jgi:hypothetical protein
MIRRRSWTAAAPLLMAVLLAAGCGDDDNPAGPDGGGLMLTLDGIESLGPGFVYEGWILVGGNPVSTGTFTVDGSGALSQSSFDVDGGQLATATKFILTIEPSPDPDPAPAATKYLAGDFAGDTAMLSVADGAALGSDFTAASGSFILQTPSTAAVAGDCASGIWWLDPAGPAASLVLPALPPGWVYEGWVVGPEGSVSTGRFSQAAGADSDGPGSTAGPFGTPPFPGQDFINPLVSLVGYRAVITIEPAPDDSPGPFTLKPLVDMNVEDVGPGVLQPMANGAGAFPTGTARR